MGGGGLGEAAMAAAAAAAAAAADLNVLASLPQAPIPPHEFASLAAECYMDPSTPSSGPGVHQTASLLGSVPISHHLAVEEHDLVKDHAGVYSPEYISL